MAQRFFGAGRFGACVSADAATDFTAAGVFGDESSLLALLATRGDVVSGFLLMC